MPDKPSSFAKFNTWLEEHTTSITFVQKTLFIHNLCVMVRAGLSLVDGLRILHDQTENKALKKAIGEIKLQVEKGRSFSEVLTDYSKIFPPIYVSMVAAGETSGKLEEALEQVAAQMQKSHEFSSRIRGAMMYPAVVLTAMGAIAIEMVVFILPKLLDMFNDFHAQLPWTTQILIFIVNSVQHYGIFMLVGIIILVALFVQLMKKVGFKRFIHRLLLRLPIFGVIIKKINLARFTRTLCSLLQSAVPIIEAVKIAAKVEGNVIYYDDLLATSEVLKKGVPLSEGLAAYPSEFPPMVVQMIMIGEQTGQVEQMLGELAKYYEDEVDETMKNFSTIIEPVLILLLGLAVAFIAVAVIMPMYALDSAA